MNLFLSLASHPLAQHCSLPSSCCPSVLVQLTEEVSCGGQGELSEQDSLNLSCLNETNPREGQELYVLS